MNDTYREILIRKEPSASDKAKKGGLILLDVVLWAAGLVFYLPLMLVALVFLIVMIVYLLPRFDVEYEYLYVNGGIDVDAIYAKQKRKRVAEYDVNDLEILAPDKSHALDSYLKNGNVKVMDFTSGKPDVRAYTLVFNSDSAKQIVRLELDEEIVADIRRLAPRKVNLY